MILKRSIFIIGASIDGLILSAIHLSLLLFLFDRSGHGQLFVFLLLSLHPEQVTSISARELVQRLRLSHFKAFIVTLGKKFLLTLLNLCPFLLDTEHLLSLPLLNELTITDMFLFGLVAKLPESSKGKEEVSTRMYG